MCHFSILMPAGRLDALRSDSLQTRAVLLCGVGRAVHLDLVNTDLGVGLAMSLQLFVLLLALVVEDQDLRAAAFADDGADHFRGRWLGHRSGFA